MCFDYVLDGINGKATRKERVVFGFRWSCRVKCCGFAVGCVRGNGEFNASGTLLVDGHAVFHCCSLLRGGENLQKKTEVENV